MVGNATGDMIGDSVGSRKLVEGQGKGLLSVTPKDGYADGAYVVGAIDDAGTEGATDVGL